MPIHPERVTTAPSGNDQLLYFTTSSLDDGDRRLWFLSDRDGNPNIFMQNLDDGGCRQLTFNTKGRMWQYQGFGGTPGQGLAVWSVALDSHKGEIYFIQDNRICSVDAQGSLRFLADILPGQTTAFIAVSDCGRWLCVPTTDERALLQPMAEGIAPGGAKAIDQRCQDEGLNSFLDVYDTHSGARVLHLAVPRCWITHVQFRPGQPEQILYNHEWPSQVGVRRMWLWDGERHQCLRPSSPSCSPEDWVCHEVWSQGGESVVYHGGFRNGAAFLGRLHVGNGQRTEISLPEGWKRYGHFQVPSQRDDVVVCDGYYQTESDLAGAARWLSLQKVDWQAGHIDWIPLCQHQSSWKNQDDHPHPIFDHAGKWVYFTGGTPEGRRAVYRIAVPESLRP